ncbi:MAG: tRNA (N6-threonylcarbamoyladenosine(37)-N6)-methyltransferase TrmO [Bacteroidetes bacterium]|nr:MAG: tRNA (N6-threonylcarbamoyladenosine(37)-N6)-methyltransferase TrmO [Bacteroidota bacterium]
MDNICYKPIGIIHSEFKEPKGTPIQPTASKNNSGTVEIFPEFIEGLQDLEHFSHIFLIYHFHLAKKTSLKVKPFMDAHEHGIFSIRAPSRPNSIGISIVRLSKIENNTVYIKDVDIIDGTPLLDIKPYVAEFDIRKVTKNGWLKHNVYKLGNTKDDERFVK